jgi:hypothetical protein
VEYQVGLGSGEGYGVSGLCGMRDDEMGRMLITYRLTEEAVIADSGAYSFGMAYCDVDNLERKSSLGRMWALD